MKDIMDVYEENRFPGLLEILFALIIFIDLSLAIWISFMAQLHISTIPYLKIVYMILLPITYIFPLVEIMILKKAKKHLIVITNTYLSVRIFYLSFYFLNEIQYRLTEVIDKTDRAKILSIIYSGIFCIAFILVFSIIWMILINLSKRIKSHIIDNPGNANIS